MQQQELWLQTDRSHQTIRRLAASSVGTSTMKIGEVDMWKVRYKGHTELLIVSVTRTQECSVCISIANFIEFAK
jgi:hypothetical protein